MRMQPASGTLLIVMTFLLAGLLQVIALPDAISAGRPLWIGMMLVFWVLALPHRVGVLAGLLAGLYADLLLGRVLGVYAISFALLAYLTLNSYKRLRVYGALQQSFAVFLLLGVAAFSAHILNSSLGENTVSPMLTLLPVLFSALFWRPLFGMLRILQIRFMVR